jgi:hypothetical protein
MTYEDWLWLKLLLVAVAAFVYRFIVGLLGPAPRDNQSERTDR